MAHPIDNDLLLLKQVTDWRYGEGVHDHKNVIIVRGVVEYNRDPQRRGRVMVRVLEDGPEMRIKNPEQVRKATFELGWCEPLFSFGSGMNYGSFTVPTVGSRVFVMYERGIQDNPLYFGGWLANTTRKRRYGITKSTESPPVHPDTGEQIYPEMPTPYWDSWEEEQGPEIPLELFDMVDHQPDTHMLFKTLKGATLQIRERDESESLHLVDRIGAGLFFESPTELSESGVFRRERRHAYKHEHYSLEDVSPYNHSVRLVNVGRSGLSIEANRFKDDAIHLVSHETSETDPSFETIQNKVQVSLDRGERFVKVAYRQDDGEEGHIIFDFVKHELEINGINEVKIKSSNKVFLESPTVVVRGNLDVEGEIRQVGDHKITFIGSDTDPEGTSMRNIQTHDNRDDTGVHPTPSKTEVFDREGFFRDNTVKNSSPAFWR